MSQQANSGSDPAITSFAFVIGFCLAIWVIWFLFHTQICIVMLGLYSLVSQMWDWAPMLQTDRHHKLMQALSARIGRLDPSSLTFMQLMSVGQLAMRNLIPIVLLFTVLAIRSLKKNDFASRFRQEMDFNALVRRLNPLFPGTTPALNKDLLNKDPDVGPWRRMDDYLSFALRHQLLLTKTGKVIKRRRESTKAHTYQHQKACQIFAKQLGPKTESVWNDSLRSKAPHYYVLAAAFCARMNRQRKQADELLDELSRHFREGTENPKKGTRTPHSLPVSKADKLWKKYAYTEVVRSVIARHSYINVAMYALLIECRQCSGVLQPALFLWLKPVDRTLWYVLHGAGLRVASVESGGARAQYLAEIANGGPIAKPMVDEASFALRESLSDEGWIHPESDDYKPMETFEDDNPASDLAAGRADENAYA